MADIPPNLIERAAARLAKTAPAGNPVASEQLSPQAPRPVDGPTDALQNHDRLPPVPKPVQQRSVVVSPTSLAARGIALPSAGLSRTVEEFRLLKRQVLAMMPSNRNAPASVDHNRILLVTSANEGDGKTFVAINLALALAYEKDIRVLLMDGDAYRQSALSYMGVSAGAGWVDYVANASLTLEDVLLRTNVPNLSVLPAGQGRDEIPELMSSRRMQQLFDELQRDNAEQIIVIDSLPCLASTEPGILAALAGQTLFVVAAHATGRQDVESSLRLLKASPNVSLLLNKAEPLLSEQFKGYYGYRYQQQQPAEARR